jgi:hypothetical protein
MKQLQIELENIQLQWDKMKIGENMTFKPKPIMHFEKSVDDNGRTFIIVKPCGFCNNGSHCMDVVVVSCKHTFHPFCLGVMLK